MDDKTNIRVRRTGFAVVSVLVATVLMAALPGLLLAADINVTTTTVSEVDDGECSLVEAIEAANTNAPTLGCPGGDDNDDTVILQAGQTYEVTTIDNVQGIEGAVGLPVVTGELTIRGNNATIQRSSVDQFRFLYMKAPLALHDLTLRGGDSDRAGGAVLALYPLAVTNTRFVSNRASQWGGAIYQRDAGLSIRDSLFERNVSEQGGGALRTEQGAVIVNSDFFSNAGHSLGAVAAIMGAEVSDSEFRNNRVVNGDGGALFAQATTSLTNTTFISNSASSTGGAISVRDAGIRIVDSLFQDNTSAQIAAAVGVDTGIVIINSDFLSNTGGFKGGAVSAEEPGASGFSPQNPVEVTNSRFRNNRATDGNGAAIFTRGVITVSSSSFISNTALRGGGAIDVGGRVRVVASQFIENHSIENTGGAINNPTFEPMGVNWISDSDFIANSAYGSGGAVNSGFPFSIHNTRFERNRATGEFAAGGGLSTSNAVTVTDSVFMTNTSQYAGGGLDSDATWIIRTRFEANRTSHEGGGARTEAATIVDSDFISNTATAFAITTSGGGALHARGPVSITRGSFLRNVGENQGGAVWTTFPIAVMDASLTGNSTAGDGGAVYAGSSATISGVALESNHAGGFGGALKVSDDSTLTDSTFYSNTSDNIGGAISLQGPSTVTNVEVVGNESVERGGGIAATDSLTLTQALILGNTSGDQGGGIAVDQQIWADRVVIADNFAKLSGGGIHVRGPGANHSRIGNALFYDNWSDGFGNNLHLLSTIPNVGTGSVDLIHATIATSRVFTGSGVYISGSAGASVDIRNSIISDNETGVEIDEFAVGSVTFSTDYNFFNNGTNLVPDLPLGANSLTGNPGFVNRPGRDFHLTPTSTAVDTAANAGVTHDFEGDTRPLIAGYDIGADEVEPCTPLTGVAVDGPANGVTGSDYVYSALVTPAGAIGPVVYEWTPAPASGQGASKATYRWDQAGTKNVAVEVSNCGDTAMASAERNIDIVEETEINKVLLPALRK